MDDYEVGDDPRLPDDRVEVPMSEWSGWRFDSHYEIFSLLDGENLARQVGSQEPTHHKVGNKSPTNPLAPREFLSKVGPMDTNSRWIAQRWLFIYLFIYVRLCVGSSSIKLTRFLRPSQALVQALVA
jgi:hypothetical protein